MSATHLPITDVVPSHVLLDERFDMAVLAETDSFLTVDYPSPTLFDEIRWVAERLKWVEDSIAVDATLFGEASFEGNTKELAESILANAQDAAFAVFLSLERDAERLVGSGIPVDNLLIIQLDGWGKSALKLGRLQMCSHRSTFPGGDTTRP